MTETTNYQESRQQLLRRAAAGVDVSKALDKLEGEQADAEKAASRAAEVSGVQAAIEREQAKAALQAQYNEAANGFIEAANLANELAADAEKAFADAVTAFEAWRGAVDGARATGSQAHHLQMQGANPIKLPILPGTGELSLHFVRRFGDGVFAQSTWGKLPRAS